MKQELRRNKENAMISGVCSGFAEYYKMDVTLVRILFVFITLFFAIIGGILMYAIAAMVMPVKEPEKLDDDIFSDYDEKY